MRSILLVTAISFLLGLATTVTVSAEPDLRIWEWSQLKATKAAMDNPSPELSRSLKMLRKEADKALSTKSYSVTYNEFVPPSGDKHDYASFGAYWWPDPSKEDGLPFIRHDGKTNEAQKSLGDKNEFGAFAKDIETLSLAYFYFGDEQYAAHSIHLLNDWFLNPETRMNPHLEYAQAVLGRNHGKNSGVIDTRDFIHVIESLELLKQSPDYKTELDTGLKQWFREFLGWLKSSKLGIGESEANNNHGSWFHAQAMRIALMLGDEQTARELLDNVRKKLIPHQIMPDGTQPEELARTNSLHYSLFNLHALATIARMSESLDADLWQDRNSEGRGMRSAADYLLPYMTGKADWPHRQISEYHVSPLVKTYFRLMSVRYQEPSWLQVSDKYATKTSAGDHSLFLASAIQEKN